MDIIQRIDRLGAWLSEVEKSLDSPIWKEGVFVYKEITPKHVAYLKAVRAVSSLHSLLLLFSRGLVIDGGTIMRCISEALSEIYFLLENYPSTSSNVDQFVSHFRATSLIGEEEKVANVLSRKVHTAEARIFQNQLNFDESIKKIRNIYESFSGYVHSDYPAIMEIYGGFPGDQKFNISGVRNAERIATYLEWVEETIRSAELAMGFIAFKFGLNELFDEIRNSLK